MPQKLKKKTHKFFLKENPPIFTATMPTFEPLIRSIQIISQLCNIKSVVQYFLSRGEKYETKKLICAV